MKKILLFLGILFLSSSLFAEKISVFVASSASKAMNEVKDEFLKEHKNDEVELVFGASGKYYQILKQGREFDLFFSADTKYAKQIADDQNAITEPKVYVLGVVALYSLDENLLKGGVEELGKKLDKINHLSIANSKVAPYGVAATQVLEKLNLNKALDGKIVLGDNISQPVVHVDNGVAELSIVAYSLVSQVNNPKGKAVIVDSKYFSPLEQSFVVTKYAKNKPLAMEFSNFISSPKAKEIFKKYGFDTP